MRTQPNKTTFPKDQLLAPKIHNVIILDGSGSMGGAKYESAKAGIALDLQTCNNENFTSYSFVEFNNDSPISITTHYWLTSLSEVNLKFNGAKSGTPLYYTIGQTLEKLLQDIPKEDKVLVKIFTDGQNTLGYGKYSDPVELQPLIATCEARGFTITFIGTKQDTQEIIRNVKINVSNTLVHDNTGKGVETAFNVQAEATRGYSKRVSKGEDVTLGFYSKTIINND
jgi:Mg-chelatase subunit ChlD